MGSPPASAGDTGSAPGPGIPHVPQGSSTRAPQLLKPTHLEPMLCDKRSPCNEKPAHGKEEQLPFTQRERAYTATKTQHDQKENRTKDEE